MNSNSDQPNDAAEQDKLATEVARIDPSLMLVLLDKAPSPIFAKDMELRYTACNKAMSDFTGIPRDVLLGKTPHELYPPDLAGKFTEMDMELLEAGGVQVYEGQMLHADGSIREIHYHKAAIYDDKNKSITGLVGVMTDITRRKRDEELRNEIERLIQHDLRAPANAAVQLAQLLRDTTTLTEDQRLNLLDHLERSGENMIETLNSSLDLYKIETGSYQYNPVQFDCYASIMALIESLTKKVQFARINLKVQVSGKSLMHWNHSKCKGALHLFRKSLQNLLVNALEASEPGSEVIVELSSENDCTIKVTNSGVVPVEIRNNFFDKYSTCGKKNGTGLGTYSARMMVRAMGGDITMTTSDADNETTVTVRIPC